MQVNPFNHRPAAEIQTMDVLGTVLNVIDVVERAIAVFHKVRDCPAQMRLIGERMERLNSRLRVVEGFIRSQTIDDSRNDVLLDIVEDIRGDSKRVEVLFTKFNDDRGPFGLQFRFKPLTQVYFALGSNAEEMRDLADEIEKHRLDLREELEFMGVVGINAIHNALKSQAPIQDSHTPEGTSNLVSVGGSKQASTLSPGPLPPRNDYNIIFVDPYNQARSIAAEAYTKLLREWTVRTGGVWRIKLIHSAGFFVRNPGELGPMVEKMKYRYPTFKLSVKEGGKAPNPTALAALFDNKMFAHPFKEDVKRQIEARRARGMAKTIFKTYDCIVVFTNREYDNLIRLRKELIASDGKQAVTGGGKGRVVHLGSYMHQSLNETPKEILAPKEDFDRAQWNVRVGQTKTAIKGFLKREIGWEQPKKGTTVSS